MAKKRKTHAVSGAVSDLKLRAQLRVLRESVERAHPGEDAGDRLRAIVRSAPPSPGMLGEIAALAEQLGDHQLLEWAVLRLTEVSPGNPDTILSAADVCLGNGHLAEGVELLRRTARRWPAHPAAGEARRMLAAIEPGLSALLSEAGLRGDELEAARLNERSQSLLVLGRAREAEASARQAVALCPGFASAGNNLSLALWAQGDAPAALECTDRILTARPDNVHALANRVRYLVALGRGAEAHTTAERLLLSTAPATDRTLKKMEAFALLGEHRTVAGLFEARDKAATSQAEVLLLHYAAAANASLGRTKNARRLWRDAIDADPSFALARENLRDLDAGEEDRHGPWYSTLPDLFPMEALLELDGWRGADESDERAEARIRALVRGRPHLLAHVPLLLEMGGPEAARLALALAAITKDPACVRLARQFIEGRRGSDALRLEGLHLLARQGLVDTGGALKMFVRGREAEVRYSEMEIHLEAEERHRGRTAELEYEGLRAMKRGDASKAEECFREALALAPDSPDLVQNWCGALEQLGRRAEALRHLEALHARHPDYLFARCSLAQLRVREGNVSEAERLLSPLESMARFHATEMTAYAKARQEIAIARGDRRAADHWRKMATEASERFLESL